MTKFRIEIEIDTRDEQLDAAIYHVRERLGLFQCTVIKGEVVKETEKKPCP